jgi:hypothetical protein
MAVKPRMSAQTSPTPPPWLNAAYGQVPLPICVTHRKKLVFVNQEFESFYECRSKDVLGEEMKDVVVTTPQLKKQVTAINRLKTALNVGGLGIQHFFNQSRGQEVGVLVVAFEVKDQGNSFSVGIAIPDRINNLFRFLIRNLVTDDFDEQAFLNQLTKKQIRFLKDLSSPRTTAKAAGGTRTLNGAADAVPPIRNKLEKNGWLRSGVHFVVRDLKLLAMALGPLLQDSGSVSVRRRSLKRGATVSKQLKLRGEKR